MSQQDSKKENAATGFYTTRQADDEYKIRGMQDDEDKNQSKVGEDDGEAVAGDQKKKKRKKRKKNKNKGADPTSQEK